MLKIARRLGSAMTSNTSTLLIYALRHMPAKAYLMSKCKDNVKISQVHVGLQAFSSARHLLVLKCALEPAGIPAAPPPSLRECRALSAMFQFSCPRLRRPLRGNAAHCRPCSNFLARGFAARSAGMLRIVGHVPISLPAAPPPAPRECCAFSGLASLIASFSGCAADVAAINHSDYSQSVATRSRELPGESK